MSRSTPALIGCFVFGVVSLVLTGVGDGLLVASHYRVWDLLLPAGFGPQYGLAALWIPFVLTIQAGFFTLLGIPFLCHSSAFIAALRRVLLDLGRCLAVVSATLMLVSSIVAFLSKNFSPLDFQDAINMGIAGGILSAVGMMALVVSQSCSYLALQASQDEAERRRYKSLNNDI